MHPAIVRRAIVAAATLSILTFSATFAETVTGDGDVLAPGIQGTVSLGTAAPGADIRLNVRFQVDCTGTSHVDANQLVRLTPGTITVPVGGSYGVGSTMFAPAAGWPADGQDCPAGIAPFVSPLVPVIVTAPPDPGVGYRYSFTWNRSLTPTTPTDSTVFGGPSTTIVFLLDVADNTAPALHLPADSTVEGNTTGGATAAYTVSATDAEDSVAPTPSCSPAVGALLPLGTNTISCSVTDGGGLTTTGSFAITVVDTTAPVMPNVADFEIVTADPAGATFDIGFPSFVELVDPHPTRVCDPENGTLIPVGVTTVTCTARDATGNQSSISFHVTVTYVPPVTWSALWGEPIGAAGPLVIGSGRSIPVKVEMFANGVEQTTGHAVLSVVPCGGSTALEMALTRDAGRWNGKLDASALPGPGCYVATVSLDGNVAGSFGIDNRGATPVSGGPKGNGKR